MANRLWTMLANRLGANNLALCSGQFAMSLLQTFFMFYYVKVFLNVYKVDELWFSIAQVLFVFWNAINDPIFGYAQDISDSWFHCRQKVIAYLGPFLAGAFLLLWFPWNGGMVTWLAGVHLIFGLFFYDAFYSCINVAWSALFAESTRANERITAVKYSQFAILLSINVLPITEKISKSTENFFAFQCIGIGIAILSIICFKIVGNFKCEKQEVSTTDSTSVTKSDLFMQKLKFALKLTKQVLMERKFRSIAVTYFIHACRSTAHLNFAAITTQLLIPQTILANGSWQISLFYGVCTIVPQLLVILSGGFITKFGATTILFSSFSASVIISLAFVFIANGQPYVIMLFMFLDSILVHSVAPLFQVLLAEYVDEDAVQFARKRPISSTIYSLSSFLVRPAQSITPTIIVIILTHYGYKEFLKNKIASDELMTCVFYVLGLTSLLLAASQYYIFRAFTTTKLSGSIKIDDFVL